MYLASDGRLLAVDYSMLNKKGQTHTNFGQSSLVPFVFLRSYQTPDDAASHR
jgi:hypothetical protein